MRPLQVFLAVCVPAFLFLACSDDDNEGAAAADFNKTYCDLTAGFCCPKSGQKYDGITCQALFLLSDGQFDKAAADACLASVRAAQSSATFCTDNGGPAVDTACNAVYKSTKKGTVPAGGSCKSDSDCAAPDNAEAECVYAVGDGKTVQQTCEVRIHGAAGSDCAGNKTDGAAGTVTAGQSAGPEVTVCWESDGLFCSVDTKKCAPQAALGAKCNPSDYHSCGKTAFCGKAQSTDAESTCIALTPLGGDCQALSFEDRCADGSYCEPNSRKCTANVPIGGACDGSSSDACGRNASCNNGVCSAGGLGLLLLCGSQQ